ncbi:6-phosphogluconolactonase [Niabella yanshanensis]|uniref:6-phosphogluconolactonase n=1 Tax=Niabella yanshanensis TaxID=577386 RepID=A0ABZ0W869_9BACT|nr:6-phosphogluconolactonase [Niabella yanshanensis]WQD38310.1 6-phosphogluconolactonase [Niabella yanshanensis]
MEKDILMHYELQTNNVHVFENRRLLGNAAGSDIENAIIKLLSVKDELRMIFAAAPSQNEVLEYLSSSPRIDWSRVVAFNMDEYIGLPDNSNALFASYLNEKIFNKVRFKAVNLITAGHAVEEEIARFEKLIKAKPIDIVCLGIGENGHIAFNDPPVADFNDEALIKVVELDHLCRMQQVNEGCFLHLDEVPKTALTLTIPVIMQAGQLFCMVPGSSKKQAVWGTLMEPISEACPATILRTHANCSFYFDKESYQLVEERSKKQ